MPDAEFKTMVIKMIKDRGRMGDFCENLNKELLSIKT